LQCIVTIGLGSVNMTDAHRHGAPRFPQGSRFPMIRFTTGPAATPRIATPGAFALPARRRLGQRPGGPHRPLRDTGRMWGGLDAEPYRLALCVPTSGTAGLWGASSLACARLAVEQWNDEGGVRGREVRLHLIDASDESESVENELADLAAETGVDAIIGMHTSSVRERITSAGALAVPFVYTPLYEGGALPAGVYAVGETPAMQLLPPLDWMIERWRLSRWFLAGNDYLWPRRTHALARRRIVERGCSVVGDAFVPLGRCDHDRLIDAIRSSGAQAVLLSMVGQDAIDFGRAFRDSGLAERMPRLGCAIEENGLLAMGAECSEGLYVASGYFAGLATDRNGAFRERYWSRFGERAPALNALGQSTWEGVAFLRGLLDGSRHPDGSVRYDSIRGTRWRSNEHKTTPIYLAAAEGLGFGIVRTFAPT
jgi:urea transport system substrate-binding protein